MTKLPVTQHRFRWFHLVLGATVGIAVLAFALSIYKTRSDLFDSELWRDQTLIDKGIRLKMADRLIARRTLYGMSRPAVIKMLGEPPPEYFRDWDLVDRLGMERGFIGIDSEWLVIRLGPDNRVADYRIVTD